MNDLAPCFVGKTRAARAGERPVLITLPNNDINFEQLVPVAPGNLLEGNVLLIAPNFSHELISHRGEEVGYALEGALELTVGEDKCIVGPGDRSISALTRPTSTKPARLLTVSTPPTF